MGYVNRCRTVNGDVIIPIPHQVVCEVEILSHKFHNPNCDIVCFYYYDSELGAKVEVTACKDLNSNKYIHEVYFFHNREDLQHYHSRRHSNYLSMPKKYIPLAKTLIEIHKRIDFNQYNQRPN